MPPCDVIERLGLKPGMVIADIGAGTGFFALPFARAVQPGGAVWAVNLQPEMLHLLEEKLRQENSSDNIRPLEGDATHTGLPDGACDLAFLANIWHELDDSHVVLAEMRRILRLRDRHKINRTFIWCVGVWCSSILRETYRAPAGSRLRPYQKL